MSYWPIGHSPGKAAELAREEVKKGVLGNPKTNRIQAPIQAASQDTKGRVGDILKKNK